jgi:transposase-like protein
MSSAMISVRIRYVLKRFYFSVNMFNCTSQPSLSQTGVANAVCAVPLLMGVLAELKKRGIQDILIACMDGLTGFPQTAHSVYPDTRVRLCTWTLVRVHMARNPTKFVSYKDLKKVCADLKAVYSDNTEEAGRDALEEFGKTWNGKYPMIYKSWDQRWDDLNEFFKYPPEIRRAIYTTNAIELPASQGY